MPDLTKEEKDQQFAELAAKYDGEYATRNAGIPEAGGIAYCTMFSPTGLPVNITGRGVNPLRAIEALVEALQIAGPRWGLTPEKNIPVASAPAVSAPVRIALEEGNKPLAKATAEAELEVPPPPAGKQWIKFEANTVRVLPQPDNKATLEFYADGKKFAGVKVNKWKIESVNGLMKHVTTEDMSKAAEYKLHCAVYYTEGAEGKMKGDDGQEKTFHYKDVAHVRPL
jgi:hypothetical protein